MSKPDSTPKRPRVPERLTCCIWYDQRIVPEKLKTTCGESVRVEFPGEWNLGEGPDFRNAVLHIGGRRLRGDVEVHNCHAGWTQHGHHRNPAYNGVVLHVALWPGEDDGPIRLENGQTAPHVVLSSCLDEKLERLLKVLDAEKYPAASDSGAGRCHDELAANGSTNLGELLDAAGTGRLLDKAKSLRERAARDGFEAAFAAGYLELAGSGANKPQFAGLAGAAHYDLLRKIHSQKGKRESAEAYEALLFGLAGFLDAIDEAQMGSQHERLLVEIWRTLSSKYGLAPVVSRGEWNLKGLRPANHPHRKLAGAARWLAAQMGRGLDGLLFALIGEFKRVLIAPENRRSILDRANVRFQVEAEGHWARRSTLLSTSTLEKPPALIGRGHASVFIVNLVFPWLLAWAERDCDADLWRAVMKLYEAHSALPRNRLSSLMARRIGAGDLLRRGEKRQQGLLALYFDFCREDLRDCASCSLPAAMEMTFYQRLAGRAGDSQNHCTP